MMEKTCERRRAGRSDAVFGAGRWDERDAKVIHMADPPHDGDSGPDILHHLTREERETLAAAGRERRYEAGELLFQQGDAHDGLVFILEGRVRSYYESPRGRAITLAYWPSGHFVGAPQVLGGGEHMWTSVAIEPTLGLLVPGAATEALVRSMPNLAVALIEGLVYKSKCYTALLQLMGTESKTVRLAHLLLTLAEPAESGRRRHVVAQELTQEELATMIGATRQAVSVALERFERDGLIERTGPRIVILDIERLKRSCD